MEPKIGEIITRDGIKYITQAISDRSCTECAFCSSYCADIVCSDFDRKDGTSVIFKKIETNMNEVKIQIPDNCELIKDGNTYIVKEKHVPPRSWEEFCERYPITAHEAAICGGSSIISANYSIGKKRRVEEDRKWIVSKEEAEAFLALMQLRQLRKAWVGDWEPTYRKASGLITKDLELNKVQTYHSIIITGHPLTFPTQKMAKEFYLCFQSLCDTAAELL